MTIRVPDDIAKAVEALSQSSGTSAEQLLVEALKAHFPPLAPELQAEFEAWELAADEDAHRLHGSPRT